MKKNLLITSVIALTASFYFSNTPDTQIKSKPIKVKKIKYDQPDKAAQWLANLRQSSDSNKSPAQLNRTIKYEIDLVEKNQRLNKSASAVDIPAFSFENLGPSNFGGRIRAFVIKSNDSNQLLAGAISGGVFKSTNAGRSWKAQDDFLPSLAIGSMINDPDEPNRVFLGTGEGFFNSDAARGAGIFVSEDFGETWNQLAATDNENFYFVNRLARVPDTDILIAATRQGIFRSQDLGQTWSEVSGFTTVGTGFVDLKIDPSDSSHLLAVHFGNPNDALSLDITAPNSVSGSYDAVLASFGPDFPINGTGNKQLTLINDGVGSTNDACETITADLTGKIALAMRGSCFFTVKVKNAQDAGAEAVVIYQNKDEQPFSMGSTDDSTADSINIPSAMISKTDGELLAPISALSGSLNNIVKTTLDRFVMESNNSGASWHQLNKSNGLPVKNVGRMELAFGADGVTYVMASNSDDETLGLWKSQGSNFNKTLSNANFIERQGWYDLAIAVDPRDSNTVFVGAIDQYITHNGGQTLVKNSQWDPAGENNEIRQYMHSDHHAYIFDPNNLNTLYVVQDGGIYKSTDNGISFHAINDGLSISQSYGIALRPDGQRITSGTQDNGSQIYFGDNNTWLEWKGGDGGYSAWDKQNARYVYGSNPDGEMFGSSTGGNSSKTMELPDTDGALFIQPFAIDPNDGKRMVVGTDNVFYTSNARNLNNATFTDISQKLSSGSVSAITFNPLNNTQVFAGMTSGDLYKIDNVGSTNSVINISPAFEQFSSITDIKIDESDNSGNTIYITRSGYGSNRLMKSTNAGTSWVSLSGNLPEMPLFQVSIDPTNSQRLFVGSELGLWVADVSTNNPQWTRYNYGVAYTRVIDLVWFGNDTLYVATHGRGTFKAQRNPLTASINKFVTTYGNVEQIGALGIIEDDGILDLGESGFLMVKIQNNSGITINQASIDIQSDALTFNQNTHINIPTIAANSYVVIPVKVSLDVNSSCLSDNLIELTINYDSLHTQSIHHLKTAANQTHILTGFEENAESFDNMMSTNTMLGSSPWTRDNTSSNSGNFSWFASDEGSYSNKTLSSPWLTMNKGGNVLDFALKYSTEGNASQYWDGVKLELREKGGLWHDIGHLSSVPYDGQLYTNNTAQAQFAWSGNQNRWRNASVNLSETYKGKTIQFRFRMVSDNSSGGAGFWVDDMKMSNVIFKQKYTCDNKSGTQALLPLTGFWFDRNKSGHGFVIEPIGRENLYFSIFYTYDDNGNPEWYTSLTTLENGVLNIDFETGTLLRSIYDSSIDPATGEPRTLDPAIIDGRLSIDFNSDVVASSTTCQDGITGRPNNLVALAKWKINDQQGQWCLEPIVAEASKGHPDIAGNWFAGVNDSGWGFSFAVAKSLFISTLYYYDETGQPRWAIGQQDGFEIGKEITIQMLDVHGYGRLDSAIETTNVSAGTITITIQNQLPGEIDINATSTIDIEYQGAQGGQWLRNNIPITILTKPHD